MSLSIRLALTGKKHRRTYRVVVAKRTSPRDGRSVEHIGSFDPWNKTQSLQLKQERYQYWVSTGAEPTKAVAALVAGTYVHNPSDYHKEIVKAKIEAEREAAEAAHAAETAVADTAESTESVDTVEATNEEAHAEEPESDAPSDVPSTDTSDETTEA